MTGKSKHYISSKDIKELLESLGLKYKETAKHILVTTPGSGSVVFPVNTELSPVMFARIRKIFKKSKILGYQEFDNFIAKESPFSKGVVKHDSIEEKHDPIYTEVRDTLLRQRLLRLGLAPLDTLIREAGVILEDRLRQTANETDANLHGVALVDAVLGPGKGKIVFSPHPGEQEGARMLYRGAIQLLRNPAMHKLIDYPEDEARHQILVIDSLLQLLPETILMANTKTGKS